MKRTRLIGLLAAVFALVLLGLAAQRGVVLLLAVLPVLYLAAAVWTRPADVQVEVERSLSAPAVQQGEAVGMKVAVTNRGPHLRSVLIEDRLPEGMEVVAGRTRLLAPLATGQRVELEYTVRSKRGSFRFESIFLTAGDAFGVFERELTLPAPATLEVLPEIIHLHSIPIRPLQTRGFAGYIPARQSGAGINFYGLRDYHPGDPQRRINWRVSARHDRDLFTNEFEQERIADVGILLDGRAHTNRRVEGRTLFDHAIRAAASLADSFLRDGNRVGLMVYGWGIEVVFPGYGKVQRERILRALARATSGHNYAMERLSNVPTRLFPAKSQIVMVSPILPDDVGTLAQLRSRGYELLVVSPNPVAFDAVPLLEAGLDLGVRFAQFERQLLLRQLQRIGVRVIDWNVDTALDMAIHTGLTGQPPTIGRAVGAAV